MISYIEESFNHGTNPEYRYTCYKRELSQTNHQNVRCGICGKTLRTNRGLLQHLNFCRRGNSDLQQTVFKPEVWNNHGYDEGYNDGGQERFCWNEVAGSRFDALIHDAYERIIQWKRNIFMLPTSASGKRYIDETMRLFSLWVNNTL